MTAAHSRTATDPVTSTDIVATTGFMTRAALIKTNMMSATASASTKMTPLLRGHCQMTVISSNIIQLSIKSSPFSAWIVAGLVISLDK